MKLSRYNIEKKEDKSCLIYNTVTSAILELDTDYEKSYYEMKEGKKCSKPDLESALLEGGMLVEDDKDEFAELLIRNKIEKIDKKRGWMKYVLDTETGVFYDSLSEATNYYPYTYNHMKQMLNINSPCKNKTSLIYV